MDMDIDIERKNSSLQVSNFTQKSQIVKYLASKYK